MNNGKGGFVLKYDLHVHTYYSDGLHSPTAVIDFAVERGLDGIAITDHDSIMGVDEALLYSKQFEKFKVIPGIELSCIYDDSEVHILGYFIDYKDDKILSITKFLRENRRDRVKKIVEKLNNLNIEIDIQNISGKNSNGFTGRVAIARELIKIGRATTIQEAFNKYLNPGKPAYVERYKLTVDDAVSLIKGAGGIPVLAHPGLLKDKYTLQYCISQGIEGIESIHSKHSKGEARKFKSIAAKNKLVSTGGSDCHGEFNNGELLLGKYYVDLDSIPEMKERLNEYL